MKEGNEGGLTPLEEKFCLVYACGPAPYNGNPRMAYSLVFDGATGSLRESDPEADARSGVEASIKANRLMARDDIKERIDQARSANVVSASTLRPRLTEALLRIADECSTAEYEDRFGTKLSPAALRSVAVSAISKLTDMYGIKEDIAHKVMLEGAGGEGITFNLVVPAKENEVGPVIE